MATRFDRTAHWAIGLGPEGDGDESISGRHRYARPSVHFARREAAKLGRCNLELGLNPWESHSDAVLEQKLAQ